MISFRHQPSNPIIRQSASVLHPRAVALVPGPRADMPGVTHRPKPYGSYEPVKIDHANLGLSHSDRTCTCTPSINNTFLSLCREDQAKIRDAKHSQSTNRGDTHSKISNYLRKSTTENDADKTESPRELQSNLSRLLETVHDEGAQEEKKTSQEVNSLKHLCR